MPLNAHAVVAQVDKLPVHAHAVVAQVDTLPPHASAVAVTLDKLAIDNDPRSTSRTKSAPNPARHAPYPPAGNLCVVIIRVALQPALQAVTLPDEPSVPGVQVVFVDRPIGMVCDGLRVGPCRTPEVGDKAVGVVDCLRPGDIWRPAGPT